MFQYVEIMGYSVSMYDFWNIVSTVVMFVYLMLKAKKFSDISPYAAKQSSSKRRMMAGIGEVFGIIVVAFALFGVLNPAFADWFTEGNANYYGSLTAWFIAITTMVSIFKTDPFYVHDMFAPALPIQLFFAKLACFCNGCCSGFEKFGTGYFNLKTKRVEFPVQMVEALVALALFVFLCGYQKRNKIPGSVFPVYLTLYAASRFITEYFRADLPNVLGPLDAYQIMSIVYILLGAVLLRVVWVHHQRISCEAEKIG